jgi:transposase
MPRDEQHTERDVLAGLLADGLSVEAIGRRFGKHPSTIAYWLRKHDLDAPNRGVYAAKGGLDREALEGLVDAGLSISEIATAVGRSKTAVRHWLGRYGMKTHRAPGGDRLRKPKPGTVIASCHVAITAPLSSCWRGAATFAASAVAPRASFGTGGR